MIKLVMILEATAGGIRKHVIDLLKGLDKNKYDITLIFSTRRADDIFISQLPELNNIGVHLINVEMCREIKPFKDIISLIAMIWAIKKIDPHVLHLHGAKAGALGRLAAITCNIKKVIYTPHGGSFHKFNSLKGHVYLAIEKILSRPYVNFIGVSKDSCRQIEFHLKAKEDKIHLIYNGIDLDHIDAKIHGCKSSRKEFGIDDNRLVILYPAVFLEAKGHMEFIDSIRLSGINLRPEVLIILAGDGPLRSRIEENIKASGLDNNFKLVGFQSKIMDYYNISDIILLPSRSEVFGYVLIEAMACSKPIIATAVGAIAEIVTDGYNGDLVPTDKIHTIIEKLNNYCDNNSKLKIYGERGRQRVESAFSLSDMIINTESLYDKLQIN